MAEPFDPYQQWLGVTSSERPPNFYQLLCLPLGESDIGEIAGEIAARRRRVEKIAEELSDESRKTTAQEILEQLAQASKMLLSRRRKADYDAQFRSATPSSPSSDQPEEPVAERAEPPAKLQPGASIKPRGKSAASDALASISVSATPTGQVSRTPRRSSTSSKRRKTSQPTPTLWWAVGGGAALLILLLAIIVSQSTGPPDGGTDRQAEWTDTSQEDRPRRSGPSRRSSATLPNSGSMADLMAAGNGASAADPSTVTGRLTIARRALVGGQRTTARHHAESAASLARSPTEKAEVHRLEQLIDAVEDFWTSAQAGLDALSVGEEFQVAEKPVTVLQRGRESVVIRLADDKHSYHLDDMPTPLIVTLVERHLADQPQVRALQIGSYHAVAPKGNRAEATRLLREAGAPGKALLIELSLLAESSR